MNTSAASVAEATAGDNQPSPPPGAADNGDDPVNGAETAAAGNNNAIAGDEEDATPPWDEEVTFQLLDKYTVSDLAAHKYYNEKSNKGQKPVALTVMGIAVAGFPAPDELESVQAISRVTNRSKSHLYNKSDILVGKQAKSHLQKEAIRRAVVKQLSANKVPKLKNWSCETLIAWLKNNPPPVLEHARKRSLKV
jgi:hypothetical protein